MSDNYKMLLTAVLVLCAFLSALSLQNQGFIIGMVFSIAFGVFACFLGNLHGYFAG